MTALFSFATPGVGDATDRASGAPGPPTIASRMLPWIDAAVEILLAGLLLFLPVAYGTTAPWSEAIAIRITAAIALCIALRIAFVPPKIPAVAAFAVAAFLALAAMQMIPMSRATVQYISPQTEQTKADLIGDLPDAHEALDPMTLTFYPWATRHDLRLVLLAVTVLMAIVCVYRDERRIHRLLWTIALIGGGIGLVALAQDVTGTTRIYWRIPINFAARSGPFVNHSHFSQFMNLSIGAARGLLLATLQRKDDDEKPWLSIIVLSAMIVLGLLTVSLSLSRGGVIAIAVAGCVTLLVLLLRRSSRWLVGVIAGLAILSLLGLIYAGFDSVYERMRDLGAIFGRLQMVRDATAIIGRFPMTGIGLGTFQWVFPSYDHSNGAAVATHLENEYVQALAEMGWGGFALLLLFVLTVWMHYARAVRAGGSAGVAVIGLGYGLVAVMVHSLSDFGQHVPAAACLSAAICGVILNLGDAPARRTPVPRSAALLLASSIVIITIWTVIGAESSRRSASHWNNVEQLADGLRDKDWEASQEDYAPLLASADAAVAADPGDAHHRYWAAVYHWYAVSQQIDPATGRMATTPQVIADAQRVVSLLNQARRYCPTYGTVYAMLGQIEHIYFGRPVGITHLHVAARLDPNDPTACFQSGKVDARRGKFDSAVPMLKRAIQLDYTQMYEVNNLALYQLKRPELAIQVADPSPYFLLFVFNAMLKDPAYLSQANAVLNLSIDRLEEQCKDPAINAQSLATLASYRSGQGRHLESEKWYALALQRDGSQLQWRLGHIDELTALGRVDEAITEARTARSMFPASPEAKQQLEKLVGPQSK